MTWAAPMMFFLLPATGVILVIAGILIHYRKLRLQRFFPEQVRRQMSAGTLGNLSLLRQILAALGLILVCLAIARPQWGYTWRDVERYGLEIMVVLDTSNSMRANDITPTRLQRAKWGVEELVRALDGDRIGLVGFAGDAQVLCPLTLDYGAFMMHLDDVFPGIIPRGGTNIEAGLRRAMDSFDDEQGEADRVILLISDGEAHEGDLDAVISELRAKDIRVFAIGIGDPEGALIPLPDEEGGGYLQNRQGDVVMTRLDEATLLRLTRQTNGLYTRATQQEFGVEHLIEQGLAPLKRAQLEETRIRQMEDRYQIFLGLGLFFLFLEGFARLPALWTQKTERRNA
ncbi:MAG: VWA domain-containing protein [Verrucomicrobia bacterium]|nr:VWA domain-containing protein [Verrucomicrobiota bacterium]MCH8514317.1 VWA domain-containing protein [Kiritimatiellia bacterium]